MMSVRPGRHHHNEMESQGEMDIGTPTGITFCPLVENDRSKTT